MKLHGQLGGCSDLTIFDDGGQGCRLLILLCLWLCRSVRQSAVVGLLDYFLGRGPIIVVTWFLAISVVSKQMCCPVPANCSKSGPFAWKLFLPCFCNSQHLHDYHVTHRLVMGSVHVSEVIIATICLNLQ